MNTAVISSFCAQTEPGQLFPAELERFHRIELYVFMRETAELLLRSAEFPLTYTPDKTALDLLSEAADPDNRPTNGKKPAEAVADVIAVQLGNRKVVAFATYLPEISRHSEACIEKAKRALQFLVRIARMLHEKHHHPIRVIEIVGGSKVDGVWYGETGSESEFIVNRLPMKAAVDRLLNNLEEVAVEAAKPTSIALALELEPGPLFTIGGKKSLAYLCEQISRHPMPEVRSTIGLNLDVPHWAFLSDITPAWINGRPLIKDRICNAHICDHFSAGHFGDVPPPSFRDESEFKIWLRFLSEHFRSETGDHGLPYSQSVSCELECLRNTDQVMEAFTTLETWRREVELD